MAADNSIKDYTAIGAAVVFSYIIISNTKGTKESTKDLKRKSLRRFLSGTEGCGFARKYSVNLELKLWT